MNKIIVLLVFLLISGGAKEVRSESMEFMAGLSYQTFDDYTGYDDLGASVKLRYLRYSDTNHGLFGAVDFPAIYFTLFDAMIGYGLRIGGDMFLDLGLAYAYSPIWGSRPTVVLGFGFNFSNQWYLNFPVTINTYGGISATPMFGYYF